jgi:hypothetical protein
VELEKLLKKLRAISIKVVEAIVLWRDLFRSFALLSTKVQGLSKKRAQ